MFCILINFMKIITFSMLINHLLLDIRVESLSNPVYIFFAIIIAAVVTIILNITTFVVGNKSKSYGTSILLLICLMINIIWLLYLSFLATHQEPNYSLAPDQRSNPAIKFFPFLLIVII
jgi:hypothetical protein